jgi:preprotein translocase subunit SecG
MVVEQIVLLLVVVVVLFVVIIVLVAFGCSGCLSIGGADSSSSSRTAGK